MKKLLFLLALCCGISINGFAQQDDDEIYPCIKDSVLVTIDQMPEYPGGGPKLAKFLYSNLRYPKEAVTNRIEGTVVVRFVVNKNGKVKFPTIITPLYPPCDAEALRVVNLMPNWKPGKKQGKPVNVYYSFPVRFRLSK